MCNVTILAKNKNILKISGSIIILYLLSILSYQNYLLFHSTVELFCVLVGFGITAIALHTKNMIENNQTLNYLAIAYFFIAIFDLLHTLAYDGMGVFAGNTTNLATQLWLIPRYLESVTFLFLPLIIHKPVSNRSLIFFYASTSLILLGTVYTGVFPQCYIEGVGLTLFKIISEYVSILLLCISGILLLLNRKFFEGEIPRYFLLSCGATIAAELMFTLYISVYGLANMLGHLLKLVSYYFIYKAVIEKRLQEPYLTLKKLTELLKQEIIEKNESERIRAKMEQELQKISKHESIGNLAGGIAHDFNNILTIIMGNASLAKRYLKDGEQAQQRLLEIEQASLQAKELAKQLLTYSKGGQPIKENVEIVQLIEDSLSLALSGSNVISEFQASKKAIYADVDIGQIKQVINNLVINAVQAMPQGGKIHVNITESSASEKVITLKDSSFIEISIRDEGLGIPQELLDQVFDPFFTTKATGHGLGLTTSFSIVLKHNGYMSVDSKLGEGTTFYIYLPVSKKKAPKLKKEKKEQVVFHKFKGKVLVMEDEVLIQHAIGEMLNYIGYEVHFANEGSEAINLFKNAKASGKPFDFVILDLTIPGGMGGEETNRQLLELDSNLISLVSSGYANNPIIANFEEYGFKAYLKKPYTLEELNEVIKKVNYSYKKNVKII